MASRFVKAGSLFLPERGQLPIDRPFVPSQVAATPHELAELVRDGYLRRVVRGVYVAAQVRDTLGVRARALSLVVPAGAVVTDRTAAWLRGVDVLLPGEHLAVPPVRLFHTRKGARVRRPEVASGQRMMPDSDVEVLDGVLVTTALRTACDLGMQRSADRAFGSLEAMVRSGVDPDAVNEATRRFRGYRWVRQFRELAPLVDPRPDSISESVTRLRWIRMCEPAPEPQRPVTGPYGEPWSLDMGVDELYFAVEYDGKEFHGPDAAEHDEVRRDWIEKNTPWMVRVVRQENIYGPKQDFDRLLPRWIAEARRTLPERMNRGRWYAEVGD